MKNNDCESLPDSGYVMVILKAFFIIKGDFKDDKKNGKGFLCFNFLRII